MKRVFSGIAASLFAAVFCLAGCPADPALEPVQEPLPPGGPVAEAPAEPPGGGEAALQAIPVHTPAGGGGGKGPAGPRGPERQRAKPALGDKTRAKKKASNKFIVKRRNGK